MPGGTQCKDNDVTLLKAGVATGDNKATVNSWLVAPGDTESLGGAADLWGAAWTPADINNANFGVQISAISTQNAPSAQVDFIQITVTYTVGGVVHSMTSMGVGQ